MEKRENYKVFFIASNQTVLDNSIEYSINHSGMTNLKKIISKYKIYNGENFTVSVFSFDINVNDLKEIDYDIQKQRYKAKIKLNLLEENIIFEGVILFKKDKDNFIYDFEFEENQNADKNQLISYKLNPIEQLKLYIEVLSITKDELNDKSNKEMCFALLLDSLPRPQKKFHLDFVMEYLKFSYKKEMISQNLLHFNLNSVIIPKYEIKI